MSSKSLVIVKKLQKYLEENPHIRFGQALVGIGILQMGEVDTSGGCDVTIKDPFYDSDDKILGRMT